MPEPPEKQPVRRSLSPSRQRLFRILALLLGLVGALLVAEIGMRAYLAYMFRGRIEQLSRDLPADPRKEVKLGDLVYPVPNDDIVYRLKPNARGVFRGAPVRINSLGYHDNEFQEEKPSDGFRVLVLGDSNSFNWGVLLEEGYVQVLEGAMQRIVEDKAHVEVINTGVPGYNAVMEVATFFEYGVKYDPDIVIIQYSMNDNILPDFLQENNYGTRFDKLFLFDPESLSYVMSGFQSELDLNSMRIKFDFHPEEPLIQDPDTIPDRYRHHVGPEATRGAYGRLAAACREKGIPLYCLLPPEMLWEKEKTWEKDIRYEQIRGFCKEFDIPLIDPFQRVRTYVLDHGLTSNDMALYPPYDWHPNPLRHALTAEGCLVVLFPHLEKYGVTQADLYAELERLSILTAVLTEKHIEMRSEIYRNPPPMPPDFGDATQNALPPRWERSPESTSASSSQP
ncbi:MAG: hypothetical protein PWP23_888 [Candidatus Sumerlaeota bacterium]|nr:hypothetical protein [Candidatus Sumerlaeota bacterium]